jgi:2-(1,2-epoxy-1,2-dihydrophenyl)acetyl-CoA isomerase
MGESVLFKRDNEIATIYLNEPDYLNALSPAIKDELIKSLKIVKQDHTVRVIILAGKGKSFCAGGDIKAMGGTENALQIKEKMDYTTSIIEMIQKINKPIIAAVQGYAAGAGFSLALASDMIIAEEDTKFRLAFKNVGLIPDLGLHYFLPKAVGMWKAKELIWTGATVTAQEGEKYGFVNKVVPNGMSYEVAMQVANDLSQGPSQSYAQTKSIINNSLSFDSDTVMEMENYAQSILRTTEDHFEGIQAFREKRSPTFVGK